MSNEQVNLENGEKKRTIPWKFGIIIYMYGKIIPNASIRVRFRDIVKYGFGSDGSKIDLGIQQVFDFEKNGEMIARATGPHFVYR